MTATDVPPRSHTAWGDEAWIGFAGHAGSGKDTAAELLAQYGWERVSFAEPLKTLAADWLGWSGHKAPVNRLAALTLAAVRKVKTLTGPRGWVVAAEQHLDGRLLLIALGHGARVVIGEDVWVRAATDQAHGRFAVFSDVRYPNEVDAIRDSGGCVVWIDRPGYRPANDQPSENSIGPMDCDLAVYNGGSISQLHDVLLDAIDAWIENRVAAETVATEIVTGGFGDDVDFVVKRGCE